MKFLLVRAGNREQFATELLSAESHRAKFASGLIE
jgi:hypothetical protein